MAVEPASGGYKIEKMYAAFLTLSVAHEAFSTT
jgi:hypothetical protein